MSSRRGLNVISDRLSLVNILSTHFDCSNRTIHDCSIKSIIGLILKSQIIYKTIQLGHVKILTSIFFKEKNAFSRFLESSWADLLNLPLLSIMFPRKLYSLTSAKDRFL